jgi:hypothetical protein
VDRHLTFDLPVTGVGNQVHRPTRRRQDASNGTDKAAHLVQCTNQVVAGADKARYEQVAEGVPIQLSP